MTTMLRPREVVPGVSMFPVRTPTLPPATHTNTYALGREEVLLVEPATPYEDERREWLAWARAREGRVVGVLATHHHVDHASAAGAFARALAVPLLAHPSTVERLTDLDGVTVRALSDGEKLVLGHASYRVLHTPGHAPGHVCLWNAAQKTLIAGDMVANGSTILIPPDDGGDMADYIAQLERLLDLGATTLLPAHGEPIDDPHAVLTYYVKHRRMREEKVRAAFVRLFAEFGRAPELHELVPLAYDDTPAHLHLIAAAAAEAHLVKLRREGRLDP